MATYEPVDDVAHAIRNNVVLTSVRIIEEPEGYFTLQTLEGTVLAARQDELEIRDMGDMYLDGFRAGYERREEE